MSTTYLIRSLFTPIRFIPSLPARELKLSTKTSKPWLLRNKRGVQIGGSMRGFERSQGGVICYRAKDCSGRRLRDASRHGERDYLRQKCGRMEDSCGRNEPVWFVLAPFLPMEISPLAPLLPKACDNQFIESSDPPSPWIWNFLKTLKPRCRRRCWWIMGDSGGLMDE